MNLNREFVRGLFPELSEIRDETLRERCIDTWCLAADTGGLSQDDLQKLRFVYEQLEDCMITLVEHTRYVTRTACDLAKQFAEQYGEKIEIDMDIVIAAALLHDVGKAFEHTTDGNGVLLPENRYVRHPFWGALFAEKCGCPWQVVYIIASHSFEGDQAAPMPELFIVRNADWMNYDFLAFGYKKTGIK